MPFRLCVYFIAESIFCQQQIFWKPLFYVSGIVSDNLKTRRPFYRKELSIASSIFPQAPLPVPWHFT